MATTPSSSSSSSSINKSILIAPNRHLSTFQINPSLKDKLLSSGFTVLKDLKDIRPIELSKEIGVTPKQALDILKTIKNDLEISTATSTDSAKASTDDSTQSNENDFVRRDLVVGQSAFSLLEEELNVFRIITFSKDIDQMLGGGVPTGKITEFCGVPGIGKTQMGMQLAVNAHIPDIFGGAAGHSIYIDTEGSFMTERVVEIADALVSHIACLREHYANNNENESDDTPLPPPLLSSQILENIYYYRIHDFIEQIALINILPTFLQTHTEVRIIVIDSITFHFRHDFSDMGVRSRLLQGMGNQLLSIAFKFNVAVVIINQVTTKITENDRSVLVPALGESWSHIAANRVMLYWQKGVRYANLVKSPDNKNATVPFVIVPEGIRSYEEESTD